EIKQMGGSVNIESKAGEGTKFTVRLPYTLAMSSALMVKLGEDMYAIPLNQIEGIVRVSPYELEEYFVADPPPFTYANQQYDFEYLGQLVQGQIGRASCRESVKGREGEGEAKREERD